MTAHILTLNAGSSSIKFALYGCAEALALRVSGQVEGLGAEARLIARDADGAPLADAPLAAATDHDAALRAVLDLIEARFHGARIAAVGHRIVHGGAEFAAPERLTDAVMDRLRAYEAFAPLHQPHNLAAARAARAAFPDSVQIGCFDTAFHRGHPFEVDAFAIPRAFYDEGVRRYGFHGLSYDFVAGELARIAPEQAAGRVIVAHLGAGASMCAMRAGRSIASTMGFTALDGLPMGTRPGQIDPGVLLYLMDEKGMDSAAIADLLYRDSGLKGLSGVSSDLRALHASDAPEAAQAIDCFIYRIRREIGSLAAALGGLDALVFCGGAGENAAWLRERVCSGFGWLGISLDGRKNAAGALRLSPADARAHVFVIPTNEEIVIARACVAAL